MNKWLQNDLILRFISLALAIMLWAAVTDTSLSSPSDHSYSTSTHIRDVAVHVKYNQNRYELVESPEKVELILYGGQNLLEHPPTHYQIYVDARHVGAGTHELPVQVDGLPFGIESKVEPSTVEIKLEEKLQKEVHVEADVIGNVQDGFRIGPPVINPSKVLVRGAESKLGQVTSVKAVVYLNNETKLLQKTVKLQAYGDNGPISQVNVYPEVATVQIPISIPNKTVPLYVQVGKAPPPGYAVDSINTKPDQVTVYGPKSYVENLQFYTVPNVDLSKVTKDTILLMPIPLHDQAVKVEPKEIEIYVKMVPAGTKNPKKYSG